MSIKLISKYRTCIMALAMLWIGLNHSTFPFDSKIINFFVLCGYCGVDIFVFLSGFGLYYALKKGPTYKEYIKRRFLRIFPYNVPAAIFGDILYKQGLLVSIFDILGLSIFIRNDLLFWFSSFIIVMYLIYPFYYKLFKKSPFVVTVVTIVITSIICLKIKPSYFQILYELYRIIPVCLGTLFAYMNDKDLMKPIHCWLCVFVMIVGWILMYYMYHNMGNELQHVAPLALIAPGMIILFSWIIDKLKFLQKPLNYIGQYTFQFYLIHEKFYIILILNYEKLFIPGIGFDWWINIVPFVGSFILAVLYKKIIDKIMSVIIKKTEGANE